MGYVALASRRYPAMVAFYRDRLSLPEIETWSRNRGRGCRLDLGGAKLELLDAEGAMHPLAIANAADDRVQVVIEVADADAAHRSLAPDDPPPQRFSWGAKGFSLRDPDGNAVWLLEWLAGAGSG